LKFQIKELNDNKETVEGLTKLTKISASNLTTKLFADDTILGLDTHLFVKVPGPGGSKETFSVFKSSCHLTTQK